MNDTLIKNDKLTFEEPDVIVIIFEKEDVITTSGNGEDTDPGSEWDY